MKLSHRIFLLGTGTGRLFLFFWSLVIILIVGRIIFDIRTYYFGSSLVLSGRTCRYIVHLPSGFGGREEPRPLLIYLHGSGELERNIRSLKKNNIVSFMDGAVSPEEFPFIVVSPKSDDKPWYPDQIIELLDELLEDKGTRWKIDPTRIYLTGLSMGGFGTWETGMKYPARFAAIAPVAGGYREYDPEGFENLPVWTFHGADDEIVPASYSEDMIESLYERRGISDRTRMTILDGRGHDISKTVYQNAELYRWLLKYRIGD